MGAVEELDDHVAVIDCGTLGGHQSRDLAQRVPAIEELGLGEIEKDLLGADSPLDRGNDGLAAKGRGRIIVDLHGVPPWRSWGASAKFWIQLYTSWSGRAMALSP